jgi:hypothetical protein
MVDQREREPDAAESVASRPKGEAPKREEATGRMLSVTVSESQEERGERAGRNPAQEDQRAIPPSRIER